MLGGRGSARRRRTAACTAAAFVVAVALVAGAARGAADKRAPWIAYQAGPSIRLVHVDGTGDRLATARPTGGQEHPDWSPDGRMLAFDVGFASLWTLDLETKRTSRLVRCQAPCAFVQDAAWSPDGRSIAFVRADVDADGVTTASSAILVLDVQARTVRTVWATSAATDIVFAPRWSADGKELVFEVDRFVDAGISTTEITGARIGIVSASGAAEPRWLTDFDALATTPDWNRRSGRIVFAAGSRGVVDHPGDPSNLFTIAADGTDLRRITSFGPKRGVRSSPRGRGMACGSCSRSSVAAARAAPSQRSSARTATRSGRCRAGSARTRVCSPERQTGSGGAVRVPRPRIASRRWF